MFFFFIILLFIFTAGIMCSLMVTVRKSRLVGVCRDIRWPVFLLGGMEFRTMRSDWKGGFMSKVVKGSFLSTVTVLVASLGEYIRLNGQNPNYIVMSRETCGLIDASIASSLEFSSSGFLQFRGIPIAECDKLDFGQFELV